MVTAVASTPKQRPSQNTKQPPLLPSDSDNEPPSRPKAREVTSRYLSLSTSSSSSTSNSSSSTNTTLSSINSRPSISSRRYQSPMLSSRSAITTPKSLHRAVSAERRRPAAATTPSSAEKMLVTSMRSLSVSFHGGSYSLPVSKAKPPPAAVGTPRGLRKTSPDRRKAGVRPASDRMEKNRENSNPSDQQQQHRWPGRLRAENSSFVTRSLDYGAQRAKLSGSGPVLKDLRKSMVDEISISKVVTELKLKNGIEETRGVSELESSQRLRDSLNSDVEIVSSESSANQLRGAPRGVVVPARLWQDASNRVHKVPDPASPLSTSASNRTLGPSKLTVGKKFHKDSPVSSPRELCPTMGLSPVRGGARASSPCRALTSSNSALLRGIASPSRARSCTRNSMNHNNTCSTPSMLSFAIDVRRGKSGDNRIADAHDLRLLYNRLLQWRIANANVENTMLVQRRTAELIRTRTRSCSSKARSSTGNSMNHNNTCSTPSMLSFAIDVRRGKSGENRIADAHDLRLLYNRLLQWRLANAKVENTMLVQRRTSERSLYNAWVAISKLRHSVTSKGIELQLLRHNLKLYSILKKQGPHLERWGLFDRNHCNSVSGAVKALEASTIRLPLVCGARADVLKVQEAITSAVDVMQAMASSVCSLLMKVEQMNLLVSELSKLSAQEHLLLDECIDLFSKTLIPLQVMQCSLRTQILQDCKLKASLGRKV